MLLLLNAVCAQWLYVNINVQILSQCKLHAYAATRSHYAKKMPEYTQQLHERLSCWFVFCFSIYLGRIKFREQCRRKSSWRIFIFRIGKHSIFNFHRWVTLKNIYLAVFYWFGVCRRLSFILWVMCGRQKLNNPFVKYIVYSAEGEDHRKMLTYFL